MATIDKQALLELLGDRPVAYHPILAKALSGVIEAVFVSQLLYWTGKGKLADQWIYKKQTEMEKETGLTRRNQETARRKLIELGVLEEKRVGVPATLHYRLDLERLADLVSLHTSDNVQTRQSRLSKPAELDCTDETNHNVQSVQSIPENTIDYQENTPLPQSGETPELINERADTRSETDLPNGQAQAPVLFAGQIDDGGFPSEQVADTQRLVETRWGNLRGKNVKAACVYLLLATGWGLPPPGARKRWNRELRQQVTELEFPVRDLPGYYAAAWQRLQNGTGRNGQPLTLRPYPGTLTATMEAIREERKRNEPQQQKAEWEWR